jgi:tight adherence protein B
MVSGSAATLVLAAAAGGLAAVALREGVRATPALARWARLALEPLSRAGREGYEPTSEERHRLALLGTGGALVAAAVLLGPGPAPLAALAGPVAVAAMLRRRRTSYLRGVDSGLGRAALSVADALVAGRSLRAALAEAARGSEGAGAAELSRVRADLEVGHPTADALEALRRRVASGRVDAFCDALLSQQVGGGDLARLLRRFAAASAEHDRAVADARSATAQARFTGALVAAMPAGSAIFAELLEPGFLAGLVAQPAPAILLGLAAALQVAGFLAISRLSRVEGGP